MTAVRLERIKLPTLTKEAINEVIKTPEANLSTGKGVLINPTVSEANSLYRRLWVCSLIATILVDKHLSEHDNPDQYVIVLYNHGGRYLGRVLIALAVEIGTIEDLESDSEKFYEVIRLFAEKIVCAINEAI